MTLCRNKVHSKSIIWSATTASAFKSAVWKIKWMRSSVITQAYKCCDTGKYYSWCAKLTTTLGSARHKIASTKTMWPKYRVVSGELRQNTCIAVSMSILKFSSLLPHPTPQRFDLWVLAVHVVCLEEVIWVKLNGQLALSLISQKSTWFLSPLH